MRPYWSIFRRLFARPRPKARRRGYTLSVPASAVMHGLVVVVVLRNGAP